MADALPVSYCSSEAALISAAEKRNLKMEVEGRIKAYRFVAYSAVTFSVVAVLSVCVTLPMVYNYVHHVRRQMHNEISFCKVPYHCVF
uniref:Col_cuticle_N domain-containing protein n=1 Tax=Steinernema glaseri TaxID=37863 RepID=A0A1I7Z2V2_9BILA